MEKDCFENIKAKMGSSIRMKLDIIRKNLHDNKAACLVGAGFSKNAEMDEVTTMKDWPELGVEFYKSLYGENVSSEDLKFKSVLRLASQVEAVQGRAALEALIQNALPNERVFPGRLHIELMKLPWSDVFTTNYDTLLEKAFIDADRYYYTVTNKETLLYTPHPRIVKLHGSFPDIRPFIITEEDFRTYPQKFPEFVNTVRQSLIENVLCLIGFSGDDPNFLSWLGWLRDVMGAQSSPVYQITFDKNQHDANVMLSYNLGISIVNLAEIEDLTNYTDALDFFMQYLAQEFSTKWSGSISSNVLELKDHDKVVNFIESMRDKRTTYPGWYLIPSKYLDQFDDLKTSFPFYGSIYANCNLTLQEKVDFLYELNWRLRVSFSSYDVEWYLNAIEDFATSEDAINDRKIRSKFNTLLISLLEYYRTQEDIIKYVRIKDVLSSRISELTYEQRTAFMYQQCLYAVSGLSYEEAKVFINQWVLSSMDYKGALWKSCILLEIGKNMEAESLLKDMLKAVKHNILTDSYSEKLVSARAAIEYRIWYLDVVYNDRPVKNPDFDIHGVLEHCCNMISKSNERPAEFQNTHDFNLFSFGKQWNSGESGFKGDYLGAYRYFKVYETLGIPIGTAGGISIEAQKKKTILNVLAKYNMGYAFSLLFRCGDNNVLKFVLNRDNLRQLPRETANNFFDNNIEICRKGIRSNTPADLRFRVLSVLLPALTRMSVKLDSKKNKELFGIWTSVYKNYDRFYDSSMITTLYMNTTGQDLVDCEQMALACPIKKDDSVKDMVLPQWNLKSLQIDDAAYSILIEALGSESGFKEGRVYDRLERLYQCSLSEIQREMIDAAVCLWRGGESLSLYKMLSFCVVKPVENADQLYRSLIKKELDELCALSYVNNRSSEFISKFENQLCRMQALYPFMTVEDHCRFVNKINMFFTDNEDMFKKDDSRDFFGGFHSFVEHVFFQLKVYTSMDILPSLDNDMWKDLIKTLSRYRKYKYPVLTSFVQLSYMGKYDRTRLKDLIAETLFVDRQELVDDAATALVYMAKKQGRRLNQTLLKQIISYVTYTFNERTSTYLNLLLNVLLCGGVSKEAKVQLIAYMDSFEMFQEAFSIKEEIKAEIMYHANILAGAMSVLYPKWNGVEKWKEYMDDDSMFNDVRTGFGKGVEIAQNHIL